MKADTAAKTESKIGKIKKFFKEKKLEAFTAIALGVTTLLVACVGWIGSLHGGIQAINFTKSNNLASESNATYNVAAQVYISDLFTWNTLSNLQLDLDVAKEKGNQDEARVIEAKIEKIKQNSCSPKLLAAINETDALGRNVSPFENEAFSNSYFEEAENLSRESRETMEEGEKDNTRGDAYRLVSVFYSLVLFLLGIVGVIKDRQTKKVLFTFSVCILIVSIIYMLTLPMPTGFNLSSFFSLK